MAMCTEDDHVFVVPEGHIVLLIEESQGKKTFSDYDHINGCLEALLRIWEHELAERGLPVSDDLKDLHDWIDCLHRLECFQYSREINRYKRISVSDLKQLFVQQTKSQTPPQPPTNGVGAVEAARPNSLEDANEVEVDLEDQLDYGDDDEGWDR